MDNGVSDTKIYPFYPKLYDTKYSIISPFFKKPFDVFFLIQIEENVDLKGITVRVC